MPSEIILFVNSWCNNRVARLEPFCFTKHSSYILYRHITCINTSLRVQGNNLNGLTLERGAICDTILENIRLLVECKLNLCTTVNRQVDVSYRSAFSVNNGRLQVFIPGEFDFVLSSSNFFPWFRFADTTLRVLQF